MFEFPSALLQLDVDVDAGGEIELHQRIHGLRRRIDDVEDPLMRPDLELLTRLLVHMRRAQHGELLDLGRERNGAAHPRTGSLGGVDDLARRLIEDAMIVRPEPDADVLVLDGHGPPLCDARAALLLYDLGDDAGADGAAAFADGEAQE